MSVNHIVMDFTSAIKSGFSNYANFSGRASRSEYWYFTLFSVIVNIGASLIDQILGIYIVAGLAGIALIVPGLSIAWRRLHDLDKSGAWWFIWFTCVGIIVLFVWFVTKGTAGPNRFGPDPLGSGEALPEPPTSDDGPTLEA